MLIFELNCQDGHTFEGWFDSLEELESQLQARQLECPVCGSKKIHRVLSSFAIGGKKTTPASEDSMGLTMEAMEQAARRFLNENFENVGTDFFQEALKMHYGSAPARNIRGVSSAQEEEVLREEGIEFFKLDAKGVAPPEPKKAKPGNSKKKLVN